MPAELLNISAHPAATVVELALPDDLDSSEFDRLNERIGEIFVEQSPARWVLDLGPTRYMGSAMLGLMVNIRHRVKSVNGKLALCGLSPALASALATISPSSPSSPWMRTPSATAS